MKSKNFVAAAVAVAMSLAGATATRAVAQTNPNQPAGTAVPTATPVVNFDPAKAAQPVATGNNLYCAGLIQVVSVDTNPEIVGGEEEQDQRIYSQGDFVYLSVGANAGVQENARYTVIRPRGNFRSPFSDKGNLGIYIQQVGTVRVIRVKPEVSVAVVETSCDNLLLGDLLTPVVERFPPARRAQEAQPLDRFAEPNGKATGSIVLARDGREALSRDQVVFIDLGTEDQVDVGDYLTIFRPLGRGNIIRYTTDREIVRPEDQGFESEAFRGGKFSNQAPRKKGEFATRGIATTPKVKSRRPKNLRKIVGELVITNVNRRTATAIITRTTQEVHTGDRIELQ